MAAVVPSSGNPGILAEVPPSGFESRNRPRRVIGGEVFQKQKRTSQVGLHQTPRRTTHGTAPSPNDYRLGMFTAPVSGGWIAPADCPRHNVVRPVSHTYRLVG